MVDRLDVVIELYQFDLDAVLLCPFVDDPVFAGVAPRHPAGIDRPRDLELVLFLGGSSTESETGTRQQHGGKTVKHTREYLHGNLTGYE
ncbi:hypothetical protein D3C73_1435190 [compost metagenome]